MNIEDVEALGISREQIIDRVIETCSDRLLSRLGVADEDGQVSYPSDSPLFADLKKLFQARVDSAISQIVDAHILPNVKQYIENVTLQATNKWGEKTGRPTTFVEYLVQRAETYLTEQVDFNGKSKGQDSYGSWNGTQTRITHMVHEHLHYSIDQAMKDAVKSGMTVVAKGIQETVKLKLAEVAQKLQVEVKTH